MLDLVQRALPAVQIYFASLSAHDSSLDLQELESRVLYSATPMGLAVAGEALEGNIDFEVGDNPDTFGDREWANPRLADSTVELLEQYRNQASLLDSMMDDAGLLEDRVDNLFLSLDSNFDELNSESRDVDTKQIVFLDSGIEGWQHLAADLANDPSQRDVEVFVLDRSRDGVEQISEILATRTGINAIHIVSHGNSEQLVLGQTVLTNDNMIAYAGEMMEWRSSMAEGADLLVYGCDLAATASGQSLLSTMSAVCDCDVSASGDATGHTQRGGDWELEFELGEITAETIFSAAIEDEWEGELATYVVTSTARGASAGSIRWAVNQANANPGQDLISFNIAGSGIHRISLNNTLVITESVVLDASTQSGYAIGAPVIELDGGDVGGSDPDIINILGNNVTLRGFSIIGANSNGDGIEVNGNDARIVGNFIGIDASGNVDGNRVGIRNFGDGTEIGGTDLSDRNVVSGNDLDGISLWNTSTGVVIEGNYIGVDWTGTSDFGNGLAGIYISGNSEFNTIGGVLAGEANLITNNGEEGVRVVNAGYGNSIRGNQIFGNGELEIDLAGRGVTANDFTGAIADEDFGSNRIQNFPVIDTAVFSAGTLSLAGDISGRDFVDYTIDFYATSEVDATGHGGAMRYLGSQVFTTDADGEITFSTTLSTTINAGEFVTATTTHSDGSTSEFSAAQLVTRMNSAPSLDNSEDLGMTININDFNNAGLTVAQWLNSAGTDPITDVDGDPEGIAIVGFTDSNGIWQVSIDGGGTWVSLQNVPVVDPSNAIVVDEDARLRFVPDPGFTGDSGGLRFRAWDQSDGIANGTVFVDTTPPGGATAFSPSVEEIIVRVGVTIDAQPDAYTTGENTTLTANVLDNDTYVGVGAGSLSVFSYAPVSNLGASVTMLANGDFTYDQGIQFDSLQAGESVVDRFTYRVTDGNGAFSVVQVDVTISGENDAPQLAAQTYSLSEDASNGTTFGLVVASDADGGVSGDLTYSIVGGSGQSIFDVSATGDLIVLDDTALDFETTTAYTLDVQVTDGAGVPLSAIATMTINVDDVNEAPTITISNRTTAIAEDADTSGRIKIGDIVITDDAIGTNNVSLAGSDAALFVIDGPELFLRSGVVLDFDIQDRLDVLVVVDDPTLGVTAEDADLVSVSVTDVLETVPEVIIAPISGLETTELGGAIQLQVFLSAQPTDVVVVTLISNNPGEGRLSLTTVTFDASSWNTPEMVTVTGQADSVADGDVTFEIQAVTVSADPSFDSLANSLDVINRDFLAPPTPVVNTIDDTSTEDSSEGETVLVGSVVLPAATEAPTKAAKKTRFAEVQDTGRPADNDEDESTTQKNKLGEDALEEANRNRRSYTSQITSIETKGYQTTSMSTFEPLTQQFYEDLDRLRDTMEAGANPASVVVGSVASMASVFTVGYVTWLIRGGHLLVGVLGSIPIWRFVDPLPILSEFAVDDDDDESLANMVDEANDRDDSSVSKLAIDPESSPAISSSEAPSEGMARATPESRTPLTPTIDANVSLTDPGVVQ